jgi:hypothetical protein
MRLAGLLSVAVAAVLFTACSSGGAPANARVGTPSPIAAGTASPIAAGTPSPTVTPSPLVIPSPTIPFLRCDTKDLEIQLIKEAAAAGNISATIEVRNKSNRDCDLYGYAGMQLLDAAGRPLATNVVWSTNSFFLPTPAVEEVVGLPAGTVSITPERPIPGHAYIPVGWNDVLDPCSNAAQLKVTPPDATTALVISAAPPAGSPSLMYVCSAGTLYVNPTRTAVAP